MSTRITQAEAIQLSRDEDVTVGEIEAKYGFEIITAGEANEKVAAATRSVVPELVSAAQALWDAGVKRDSTNHKPPRPKRTLGESEGTYPFNVVVTIDPAFKG